MSNLRRKIEDMLSAIAFAEGGEFETAREFMVVRKRVLLAIRLGQAGIKTLKYAVNTCKRINADLDILVVAPPGNRGEDLTSFVNEAKREHVRCRVIKKNGCLKQRIIDYINSKSDIIFVVIESSESLERECDVYDRRLSRAWDSLRCPLVVVSDAASA
jgi:hypothetical protein